MEEGTAEMKKNIMAVLYHSSDLPPETRHQYCPKESWCLFNTSSPEKFEHQDHHLDKAVHEELVSIFEAYSTDAILQKMLPGYTTNRNEAFNHVLWTVLPKSKFHGLERQRLACMTALLLFQDGNNIIPEIMRRLEIPVTDAACKTFSKLDSDRAYCWKYKSGKMEKRYSPLLKEALEQRNCEDDTGYGAGIFDATDTITADIPLPVSSIPKPADMDIVGKYVVVPYGPQFHIAKVQEQYGSAMYIECMVPVSRLEYIWK